MRKYKGWCSLLFFYVLSTSCDSQAEEQKSITLTTTTISGIGSTPGVCRRDPSDVIKVGDTYYVWYSRVEKGAPLYPSGYQATIWYATSTDAGHNWQERSEAIGKGATGAFDSTAVFTPNVLFHGGKYYLYYTAVGEGFTNQGYSEQQKTRIAVAVADAPDGPWTKPQNNIVIEPAADQEKFDSFRCDDSCLLVRDGKVWLYYKGRAWKKTPGETKMGVAVSSSPLGPFKKLNSGNPVQAEGHEVAVWAQGSGVLSLVTNVGRGAYYSPDGAVFHKAIKSLVGNAHAPGAYRPELTSHNDQGVAWGISMVHGRNPYLVRWTLELPSDLIPQSK